MDYLLFEEFHHFPWVFLFYLLRCHQMRDFVGDADRIERNLVFDADELDFDLVDDGRGGW